MKNNYKISISICAILLITAVFAIFAFQQRAQVKQKEVKVKSLSPTTTLRLLETSGTSCFVEITNNSNKEITAYQIALNDGSKVLVDRAISGIYLKSNSSFKERIQLPADNNSNFTEIVLETVVFNDNSSNGENNAATHIRERRSAIKNQLVRLLPILEDMKLYIPSAGVIMTIQAKKKDIENLSFKPVNDRSKKAYNEGIIDGKNTVENVLKDLEIELSQNNNNNSSKNYSDRLNQIKGWLYRLIN